jgi:DNA-directed RNA polymerase specialized sigma24 family protein
VAPPERDISLADPLEAVMISAEHAAVRVAFQGLSERDRELLWMRDVIGLEYEDMAQRLPLREGAIRIAVMRARRRLESAFGLVLPEEELRSTPQRQ